jgi:hypothetical protein
MSEPRLAPEQKLRVCVAVLCDGVEQHIVANLLGVNLGRVNEAVQIGRTAFGFDEYTKPKVVA